MARRNFKRFPAAESAHLTSHFGCRVPLLWKPPSAQKSADTVVPLHPKNLRYGHRITPNEYFSLG